jgi:hypothetical protein
VSSHLDLLRNLQQLLDEEVFVATWKHVLLQSVVAHQVLANFLPGISQRYISCGWHYSDFRLRKRCFIGALPQQLPRRLMLCRIR